MNVSCQIIIVVVCSQLSKTVGDFSPSAACMVPSDIRKVKLVGMELPGYLQSYGLTMKFWLMTKSNSKNVFPFETLWKSPTNNSKNDILHLEHQEEALFPH